MTAVLFIAAIVVVCAAIVAGAAYSVCELIIAAEDRRRTESCDDLCPWHEESTADL